MSDSLCPGFKLPPEQQTIRDRCFHPSWTFVEFPMEDVETSIPARFEKIVKRYPNHTAIKTGERVVTYAELNAMANRLARAVVARQGDSKAPVALLSEKGVEQIAAMIGVLKAGRYFVLLDSSHPKSRLRLIVDDCSPALTITDGKNNLLANELMPDGQAVIEIESIDDKLPSDDLCQAIPPDAFASIVHTSGSSGRPKGVINNHRGVLHHLMLRGNSERFCEHDRIALLTSGTSNFITASFAALLNGVTLLLFDVNEKAVGGLCRWLVQEKITILPMATPLFRNLCEVLTVTDRFPHIRLLRLSSETVCKADVDLYKRYFSDYSLLVNGVNSSETHLLAEYIIDRNTEIAGNEVPVGHAVQDKEILLLDEQGVPVGHNEVGEIVVRSQYLSPGYWRNPELTAAKFRRDPVDSRKRLYHTGDLGLMRPDGCLIHKGRKDFCVKIRGYRVELGEVERALQRHPAVSQTVVVAREDKSEESRLIAYYTSLEARPHSVSEFRAFIREKLPDYMVPSAFVRLDALPLTINGKVDRWALPDPDSRRPELDTPFSVPRTDLERAVAQIFSDCTGIEPVGMEDDFFDLGGDSLLLARLVSRLSTAFQRELSLGELYECSSVAGIARLLEQPAQSRAPKVEIIRSDAASNVPNLLSFGQQRLWFLDQLSPGDPAYNLLTAFQITGKLNISALEQSLNEIIARHEVLRTVFDSVDGHPRARVLPISTIAINVVDLDENSSAIEERVTLQSYCPAVARQPFDLSRGPLLRASLLRRSDDKHVLLLAVHHIVFDGWSVGVLWSELSACYEAFSCGGKPSLPRLAVQYADYARWNTEWVQNQVLQEQLEYWKQQLAGSRPLQLLTDRPRPNVQTSRGAKRYFKLSVDLSRMLKRLSHERGATLFMTLMAAFQTLLHRYTAQDDIAIGCPVSRRNRSEVENLIGFFLNTLVFRVDTSGEPGFLALLDRVRQVCLAAYAHQDLPFEKLVEELRPERQLNRNPLVDAMFAFQNTPHVAPGLGGGASVSPLDVDSGIARFDLQLFMEESGDQLAGSFSYNTLLFDDPTIARMAGHFQRLLEGIVANPEQRISDLPLLTEPEKGQLLNGWNDTQVDYPEDKCIHQLFEEQVEKTPGAIALVFEDQQLTYRELNRRSNQLAHYLRKLGVGPEALVGIWMERSIEMVIGLLGILKAGGAYVPLDPNYPTERLEFMLDDAQVSVLLTKERAFEDGGSRTDDSNDRSSFLDRRIQRISLDRDWELIARESDVNPENSATAESLAYVIYTSGSTGQPKGVVIEHRNTVAFLSWVHSTFTQEDLSGVLAGTSICFDLSVFELFAPLTCGGMVVMAENSLALTRLPAAAQVTLLNTVPSAMTELLSLRAIPSSVRVINLAGEPLRTELVRRIYESTSVRKVHDLYGPSECTTYSTWTCRTADGPQTIGRPITNTRIYILDDHRSPVPIGVVGEIYIGGDGVALGYLNRPELTAERFIHHSFDGESVERLYKTGDRARYLPDGNIEFLGRVDDQIKIRGYRIETGEIEAVLKEHPAVREAVAVAREDSPGEKRLVGYVVSNKHVEISGLRNFLKEKLLEYMVPTAFVFLDRLPLTPSGKIDRKALPKPDQDRPELEREFAAPRTPTEELLAKTWADVLKLEKVGIYDNFFDVGGHSLVATQVISRLRDALQIELPIRKLFESATIADLADVIAGKQSAAEGPTHLSGLLEELESLPDNEISRRSADETNNSEKGMEDEQ